MVFESPGKFEEWVIKTNSNEEKSIKIHEKFSIGKRFIFYVFRRIPINKKPNWIWWLIKIRDNEWGFIVPTETELNDFYKLIEFFFKYYDLDNKIKRLRKRYECDKNVVSDVS